MFSPRPDISILGTCSTRSSWQDPQNALNRMNKTPTNIRDELCASVFATVREVAILPVEPDGFVDMLYRPARKEIGHRLACNIGHILPWHMYQS